MNTLYTRFSDAVPAPRYWPTPAKAGLVLLVGALLNGGISPVAHASPAEHQAVLDLVTVQAATKQVVQSGSWSNPATWNNGVLPQAGENVIVPEGMTLTMDFINNAALKTIRVDGTLKFCTNRNIRLKMDTLVVTSTGSLEIGSEAARVAAGVTIDIVVANNGPIDRTWDPSNISRGVILQGKTRIYGSDKSAYHALAVKPDVGATQLTLAEAPKGWRVGDIISVTAVHLRLKKSTDTSYQTEDETRRIKAISGNVITLADVNAPKTLQGLTYSHVPAHPNMPVYVANLTRNVVFRSESASVPASERGHFMVMHAPDTVIMGAGFYHLGRTNKSIPIDDYKLTTGGARLQDENGDFIPDANNNPRGRYAVHFHHTGIGNAPQVICSGNAVYGSAGWGFVNHTSNVLMENNASFDVFGSHFVSEDGNELGVFRHNIAIKAEGREGIVKAGQNNHDVGHTGHGFWMESRNLVVEDNVVSGVSSAGLTYFHRNPFTDTSFDIPAENLLTPDVEIVKNLPGLRYTHVPLMHEKNMTILASGSALDVVKASRFQYHDARNMIESLHAYAVGDGLQLQYVEKYTLKDVELVADPITARWNKGLIIFKGVRDVVIMNSNLQGFKHPVLTGTTFQGAPDTTTAIFSKVQVNDRPINLETDLHNPEIYQVAYNYDPAAQKVVDTVGEGLEFKLADDSTHLLPLNLNDRLVVRGTKTDSLGESSFESTWTGPSLKAEIQKGYYTHPDGTPFIILKDVISDRVTGQTQLVSNWYNLAKDYRIPAPFLGQADF